MKIFFFGGTFDPPHLGHLEIAKYCCNSCDKFLIIPNQQSPHKINTPLAKAVDRIRMVEIMIKLLPKTELEMYEVSSRKKNFTINTVNYLKKKYPGDDLTMVIGADQLLNLNKWYMVDELFTKIKSICFYRENFIISKYSYENKIQFVKNFKWNISSSHIRELFHNGDKSVSELILPEVYSFIIKEKLYQ